MANQFAFDSAVTGLLFWMVGYFVEGFTVSGFWAGFFGAIVFSLVSWLLSALVLPVSVVVLIGSAAAILSIVATVPQVLRARAEKTPSDSIGAFRNQLNVLDRMAPNAPVRHAVQYDSLHRP